VFDLTLMTEKLLTILHNAMESYVQNYGNVFGCIYMHIYLFVI